MNRNHNTKERKPGIVYARFAGTFVLCALLGGGGRVLHLPWQGKPSFSWGRS